MIMYYVNQALWLTLKLSAPIVIATMLIGLLLGFLQAIFQLQDQSLPFGVKLIACLLILVSMGGWLGQELLLFSDQLFLLFQKNALNG